MKYLQLMLLILVLGIFSCTTTNIKPTFHSETLETVYLDPYYKWSNIPVKCFQQKGVCSPMRSISLRIVNKRYIDTNVEVSCYFKSDNMLFGRKQTVVRMRDDKIFTIWGFARNFETKVSCNITKIQ